MRQSWSGAMTQLRFRFGILAGLVFATQGTLLADVLVLRDGSRFDGVLISVRGDSIEFEHDGRRSDGRIRRYLRQDVQSIEFEDDRRDSRGRFEYGRRSGLRERVVSVDARTHWTDSGIDVRSGQDVTFAAAGEVRWGPNRRDGAAGERNSPVNQGRPMPYRNAAALIGRIGPDGDPFFIGDERQPIRMRASGRLFLGLNDDYLQDNSGALRVTIAY
jgi:hypothetical protein